MKIKKFKLILPTISIILNSSLYFLDIINIISLNCPSSTIGLPCINIFGAISLLLNAPALITYAFLNDYLGKLSINQDYVLIITLSTLFYFSLGLIIDKIKNKSIIK